MGVGLHDRSAAVRHAACRIASAERVIGAFRGAGNGVDCVSALAGQNHRCCRAADGQAGELVLQGLPGHGLVDIQAQDRVVHQGAAIFAGDRHAAVNEPAFQHSGQDHHPAGYAETGIGDIEIQRVGAQSQLPDHGRGGGGFHAVAGDAAVEHRLDPRGGEAALCDGGSGGLDRCVAGHRPRRPEPPLDNAGHQLQPPFGEMQSLVQWRQTFLQLGAGDDVWRKDSRDGMQLYVLKFHFL